MLAVILRHVNDLCLYYACFPKLTKMLVKVCWCILYLTFCNYFGLIENTVFKNQSFSLRMALTKQSNVVDQTCETCLSGKMFLLSHGAKLCSSSIFDCDMHRSFWSFSKPLLREYCNCQSNVWWRDQTMKYFCKVNVKCLTSNVWSFGQKLALMYQTLHI